MRSKYIPQGISPSSTMGDYNHSFRKGAVVSYNSRTNTYKIALETQQIIDNVEHYLDDPRINSPLSPGTIVMVAYSNEGPFIIGCKKRRGTIPSGQSPTQPGEWVKSGPGENEIGVVGLNTAYMRGSHLCELLLSGLSNIAKLISNNIELRSRGGILEMKEDGPHGPYFRLRGGFSPSENHPRQMSTGYCLELGGRQKVYFYIGDAGDSLITIDVDHDGNINIYIKEEVSVILKKLTLDILNNLDINIEENASVQVGGHMELSSNSKAEVVVTSETKVCNDNKITAVGKSMSETSKDRSIKTQDSKMKVEVGSITSLPSDGLSVDVYQGDMKFKNASLGFKAILDALTPTDGIVIGGDTAVSHFVKYEQLLPILNNIITIFDAHTHTVAGPTSGPPLGVLMSVLISPVLQTIKTIKTAIGE